MQQRNLGKNMMVSPGGLGCMGITHASGTPLTKAEGMKVLEAALDIGYTFFDTAECYTGINPDGTAAYNEEVVGAALKPVRSKVILASKCGVTHGGDHLIMDSRPQSIRKALEGSLKRLQTDYIDLYYQHRIDPNVTPEEVAGTMAELIKEGKIRAWGISETDEAYLRRAYAVCPVMAIQNRYSMMARWYEDMFPVVEELGITYVAFSPLANGFLSGQYNEKSSFEEGADFRSGMPQYTPEGFEKSRELLQMLRDMAAEKGATPGQISLAWMLCKKPFIVPIPGSRKPERLKENFESANICLSQDEIAAIEERLDAMKFLIFGGH